MTIKDLHEESREDKKEFTLIEHLEELRMVLIRSLLCIAILFPVGYYFSLPAIQALKGMCPQVKELIYIHPMGLFFTRMKVGFVLGLVVGFPYIAWQLWSFVAPALFKQERYYITRFAFASSFFFLLGAVFAIFAVFPALLRFATEMGTADIVPRLEVQKLINLAGMLIVGFGIVFQLPIVVYILVRTGLVSAATLRKNRPLIICLIFIFSAILTPPDVISQLAMAIPSVILFEASLLFASLARKKQEAKDEEKRNDASAD